MQDLISIFKEFGPYIGLPIIVYFIVNGMKTKIPFFKTVTGLRLIHFLPVILGSIGGLLLPIESVGDKVLTGGGLGCLSHVIYKFFSVTIASKTKVEDKIAKKNA